NGEKERFEQLQSLIAAVDSFTPKNDAQKELKAIVGLVAYGGKNNIPIITQRSKENNHSLVTVEQRFQNAVGASKWVTYDKLVKGVKKKANSIPSAPEPKTYPTYNLNELARPTTEFVT